jgi:hypothetical protein
MYFYKNIKNLTTKLKNIIKLNNNYMHEFYEINPFLYQKFKTKYLLKANKFFFFFCTTRTDNKNWFDDVDQLFKLIKLNYFKIYTKTIDYIVNNSVFKNINIILIKTTTLFVNFDLNETIKTDFMLLKLKNFLQQLHFKTKILSIKINKNLYVLEQFKKIKDSTYKYNLFIFLSLTQQTKYFSMSLYIKTTI